jgi:hypothetical protein
MLALGIHDARDLHILEFFNILMINSFQIMTSRLLRECDIQLFPSYAVQSNMINSPPD